MFSIIIIALQMLLVPAQNTENMTLPASAADCADPAVLMCLKNATDLITPQGCGMPPSSAISGQLDEATLKWAQCACPKLAAILDW